MNKYLQIPEIFLAVVILASVFYQRYYNNKKSNNISIEDKFTKLSQFFIVIGILGVIFVKIIGISLDLINDGKIVAFKPCINILFY